MRHTNVFKSSAACSISAKEIVFCLLHLLCDISLLSLSSVFIACAHAYVSSSISIRRLSYYVPNRRHGKCKCSDHALVCLHSSIALQSNRFGQTETKAFCLKQFSRRILCSNSFASIAFEKRNFYFTALKNVRSKCVNFFIYFHCFLFIICSAIKRFSNR